MLEKASNVNEAKELLLDLPVSSNCNILLADNRGEMIVVECSPKEKNIRKAIQINDDLSVICTVNNFQSETMKKYEWDEKDEYHTNERYNNVISAFKNFSNDVIIEYIKEILKGNKDFMCQYDKSLNFETV